MQAERIQRGLCNRVSIPHRKAKNRDAYITPMIESAFQFLIGKLKMQITKAELEAMREFQFLIGKLKIWQMGSLTKSRGGFNSS